MYSFKTQNKYLNYFLKYHGDNKGSYEMHIKTVQTGSLLIKYYEVFFFLFIGIHLEILYLYL